MNFSEAALTHLFNCFLKVLLFKSSVQALRGQAKTKSKSLLEFEEYLKTLDPSRILLNTRKRT